MTTEQKETLMKLAISAFGDIPEADQSFVLGYVNGLAQSRKSNKSERGNN